MYGTSTTLSMYYRYSVLPVLPVPLATRSRSSTIDSGSSALDLLVATSMVASTCSYTGAEDSDTSTAVDRQTPIYRIYSTIDSSTTS